MGGMKPLTEILSTPPPTGRGEGAEAARATEGAEVVTVLTALAPPGPLLLVEAGGKRIKMDFLTKSKSQSLVGRKAMQAMSLMPLGSGLGASPITGTTMRTPT